MASTNLTANLSLNQWVGTDKPKMADFNADNFKLDTAIAAHTADALLHLTAAERTAWNGAVPTVGTYVGDGITGARTFELGFSPSFGIVFAASRTLLLVNSSKNIIVYSALVSKHGTTLSAQAEPTGFTVYHSTSIVNNVHMPYLNEQGVTYVYMMFR